MDFKSFLRCLVLQVGFACLSFLSNAIQTDEEGFTSIYNRNGIECICKDLVLSKEKITDIKSFIKSSYGFIIVSGTGKNKKTGVEEDGFFYYDLSENQSQFIPLIDEHKEKFKFCSKNVLFESLNCVVGLVTRYNNEECTKDQIFVVFDCEKKELRFFPSSYNELNNIVVSCRGYLFCSTEIEGKQHLIVFDLLKNEVTTSNIGYISIQNIATNLLGGVFAVGLIKPKDGYQLMTYDYNSKIFKQVDLSFKIKSIGKELVCTKSKVFMIGSLENGLYGLIIFDILKDFVFWGSSKKFENDIELIGDKIILTCKECLFISSTDTSIFNMHKKEYQKVSFFGEINSLESMGKSHNGLVLKKFLSSEDKDNFASDDNYNSIVIIDISNYDVRYLKNLIEPNFSLQKWVTSLQGNHSIKVFNLSNEKKVDTYRIRKNAYSTLDGLILRFSDQNKYCLLRDGKAYPIDQVLESGNNQVILNQGKLIYRENIEYCTSYQKKQSLQVRSWDTIMGVWDY